VRGYANVVRSMSKPSAPADENLLTDVLEQSLGDETRTHILGCDHYEYFKRLNSGVVCNCQDNGKRLQLVKENHWRTRKIVDSINKQPKMTWLRDVVARVNSLGRSSGNIVRSDSIAPPLPGVVTAVAASSKQMKEDVRTREACESLRFLVFNTIGGPEGKRSKDGRPFYEQRCGTRDEVLQLHKVWCQMDEDGSGDVEFQEFLSFFNRSKADRLLGMRCVKYLVGNAAFEDDERPASCRIEDMMRLIWLSARQEDIDLMMSWFKEAEFEKGRVPTPPLLPPKKRRQITDNFPIRGADGGQMTWIDFRDSGLVDASIVKTLREKHGTNRFITEELLLEMFCPNGYRAHEGVKSVVDKDGQLLVKVENDLFAGWVMADKATWKHELSECGRLR